MPRDTGLIDFEIGSQRIEPISNCEARISGDLVPGLERPRASLQAQDSLIVLDRDQVGGIAAAGGVPSLRQPGAEALRSAEALLGRLDLLSAGRAWNFCVFFSVLSAIC